MAYVLGSVRASKGGAHQRLSLIRGYGGRGTSEEKPQSQLQLVSRTLQKSSERDEQVH